MPFFDCAKPSLVILEFKGGWIAKIRRCWIQVRNHVRYFRSKLRPTINISFNPVALVTVSFAIKEFSAELSVSLGFACWG